MNPFAYEPLGSPLARRSAVSKAFLLVCASAAAMRFSPLSLGILFALAVAAMPVLGISARGMGRAGGGVAVIVGLSSLLRGAFPGDGRLFDPGTLPASGVYALRLATVFLFARMFYVTTKASDAGEYLTTTIRKLRRRRPAAGMPQVPESGRSPALAADPGMMLSLTLLFLPRVFEQYRRTREALLLRSYGSTRMRPSAFQSMIQTYLFSSVKGALNSALALEARGYSPDRTISPAGLDRVDAAMLAAGLGLLALAAAGI